MPHIIIEHSKGILTQIYRDSFMRDIHNSIAGMHGCELGRIKTRAIEYDSGRTFVGEHGTFAEMVHINLKLMPGRSDEEKTELAQALYQAANTHVPADKFPNRSLTVEVSELHGPSYRP